jgi:hypothetical protein
MTSTIAGIVELFYAFHGRAGRAAFWLVSLTWCTLTEAFAYAWTESGAAAALAGRDHTMVNAALVLVSLPALASCLAVCVKRLHDRDDPFAAPLLYRKHRARVRAARSTLRRARCRYWLILHQRGGRCRPSCADSIAMAKICQAGSQRRASDSRRICFSPRRLRSAARTSGATETRANFAGFRVARTLTP